MRKKYDSFTEIDAELKRLKLQSQIDREELKLSFHETKQSFTPAKMFGGVATGILSSGLLLKLLPPIITFAMGKLSEKKEQKEERKKSWWPFG